MGAFIRRVAIPVIAFLSGLGIEVGNFESRPLAYALFVFAAIWGLVATLTWPPVASRTHFPWTIEFRRRGQEFGQPLPGDPEPLTQFARAWFLPAWESARDVAIDVRARIVPAQGVEYELYQAAVIEFATKSWRAVQDRVLRNEGGEPLEQLMVEAYKGYEHLVKWTWFMGEHVQFVFSGRPKVGEWEDLDRQFLQEFRRLLARTDFQESALQQVFKDLQDGGVAKDVRKKILAATEQRGPVVAQPQVFINHNSPTDPEQVVLKDGKVRLSMFTSVTGPVEVEDIFLEVNGLKVHDDTWTKDWLSPGLTNLWEPTFRVPEAVVGSTHECQYLVRAAGQTWASDVFRLTFLPEERGEGVGVG